MSLSHLADVIFTMGKENDPIILASDFQTIFTDVKLFNIQWFLFGCRLSSALLQPYFEKDSFFSGFEKRVCSKSNSASLNVYTF